MKRFFTSLGVAVLANGVVILGGAGAWGVYRFFQDRLREQSIIFFDYVDVAGLLVAGSTFIAHMINYKEQD